MQKEGVILGVKKDVKIVIIQLYVNLQILTPILLYNS